MNQYDDQPRSCSEYYERFNNHVEDCDGAKQNPIRCVHFRGMK